MIAISKEAGTRALIGLASMALLLFSLPCGAAPDARHDAALQAISAKFPGFHADQGELAFGDINADGIGDFAALVNDTGGHRRVVVFLGKPGGGYAYLDISGDTFAHPRVFDQVEIRSGSLFLHRDGSGGCCSHWSEDYQFKMRGGKLVLIGLELASFSPADDAQSAESASGTSVNLITGDVVRWKSGGKKRTERKSRIPRRKLIALRDFSYNEFTSEYGSELQ